MDISFVFSFIIKWAVNAGCFTRLHNDLHNSRNAHHLHYEYDDGMANGGNGVLNCSGDLCDYHLFCEFANQKKFQIFFSQQQQVSVHFFPLDSWNAAMVALQESIWWSGKIATMAAWLDIPPSHQSGICCFATEQRTVEIMSIMCEITSAMLTSVANDTRKICWTKTQTNTQTVDNCTGIIFPSAIHRHVCDETVYRTDFQSIRQPHRTGSMCHDNEHTRQFDQCDVYVFGTFHWQTTTVPNYAVWSLCMLHGYDHLWIFIAAKRLHFIRSIAVLCHGFGEQNSDIHSND